MASSSDEIPLSIDALSTVDTSQLQFIAEAIPQLIWTCSPDGKLEYANKLFGKYIGRSVSLSMGDGWLDLCHPDEVDLVRQSFADNIKLQKPFEAEFRYRRADGAYRWHSCSVLPLKDEHGKIFRWLGTNTDMQDQKQARERIFRAVFDNSYQLMTLTDLNGKILEANTPALGLIDCKLKDVKGKYLWDTLWFNYATDMQDKIKNSIERAANGEFVRFEFSHMGTNNQVTFFDFSVKPIVDDEFNPTTLIAEARDITQRKFAEQQRQISENHYRNIFENASDLIISITPDGAIIYANRAWHETLGYKKDMLQLLNLFNIVSPECRLEALSVFDEMKKGKGDGRLETTLVTIDGKMLEVEGNLNRDLLRNVHLTTAIFRDITARKVMQRKVAEFYSNVSHELRTPLTSIRASLGLIEGGMAGPISEKAEKLIQIGREESERLIRMVNDILDIKKVESGRLALNSKKLSPTDLVYSTCEKLQSIASQFDVNLSHHIETDALFSGDKDRLVQVLTNYISNAIKFSPKGECVKISVTMGLLSLRSIRFSVSDVGPGIAQEDLDKLFGMFQQLSVPPAHRGVKGSGLGLALSKSLVELHGGKVGCASKQGEGASFWFEIPIESGSLIEPE
jgi:PAS domain S-box-containing protein